MPLSSRKRKLVTNTTWDLVEPEAGPSHLFLGKVPYKQTNANPRAPSPDIFLVDLSDSDFNETIGCIDSVDKSMLSWHFFNDVESRVFVTAPSLFGKSTNLDMLNKFFRIEMNTDGLRVANVKEENGKCTEDPSNMSDNFKLFKTKRIFQECHCHLSRSECEDCKQWFYKHCGQHPIIFIDFECVINTSLSMLIESLNKMVQQAYKQHSYLVKKIFGKYMWSSTSDEEMGTHHVSTFLEYYHDVHHIKFWRSSTFEQKQIFVLEGLPLLAEYLTLHFKTPEKGVILLIDNFDAPLVDMIFRVSHNTYENINDIIDFLRHWTRKLLNDRNSSRNMQKALITACTSFGGLVLGANKRQMRRFLDRHHYSESFGFTQQEVERVVDEYVSRKYITKSKTDILQDIHKWYNGYFTLEDKTKIFSITSVLSYLRTGTVGSYWHAKVSSRCLDGLFVNDVIKFKLYRLLGEDRYGITLTRFEQIEARHISTLNTLINTPLSKRLDLEDVDLYFQFLNDCGFFSVTSATSTKLRIRILNKEIDCQIRRRVLSGLLKKWTSDFDETQVSTVIDSLALLKEKDKLRYIEFAKSLAALYSNKQLPDNHFQLQSDLYGIAENSGRFDCDAEIYIDSCNVPRMDIFLNTRGTAFVINVKHYKSAWCIVDDYKSAWCVDNALKQILDKKSYKACQEKYRDLVDIILVGVSLDSSGKFVVGYIANVDEDIDTKVAMSGRICVNSEGETLFPESRGLEN